MKKSLILSTCLVSFLFTSVQEVQANSSLSSTAVKYINTPYRYGGTSINGFDCSGYVQFVYKQLGIILPRTAKEQASIGYEVSMDQLQVGDIVYFKNSRHAPISHSGIYIGDYQFISSTTSNGVRIDHLLDSPYWSKRLAGARRISVLTTHPNSYSLAFDTQSLPLYKDISIDHPSYDILNKLNQQHIMQGLDDYFLPNEPITRLDLAQIIFGLIAPLDPPITVAFQDIAEQHLGHDAASLVASLNILPAFLDGTFRPELPMTRGQVLHALHSLNETNYNFITLHFYQNLEMNLDEVITRLEVANLIYLLLIQN